MINLNGVLVETEEQLEQELIAQGIPESQHESVRNAFHKIYVVDEAQD